MKFSDTMCEIRREFNDEGALEGLPLYMIILVVIAGIGTAVIGGWMMSAQTTELGSMEVDTDEIPESSTATIQVTTYEENGDPLEGVTVSIEGCGTGDMEEPVKLTDESGEVEFDMEKVDLNIPSDEQNDHITITAEYTGDMTRTETETVLVTE